MEFENSPMSEQERAHRLRRGVIQRLESLQRAGVSFLPKGTASATAGESKPLPPRAAAPPAPPELKKSTPVSPQPASENATAAPSPPAAKGLFNAAPAPGLPRQERHAQLDVIAREIAGCTRCAELVQNRTLTVPGVGNPEARLCLLGEGPGADEDRQGEPFVGRAGQLLNKMIAACGLRREDVFILNIVKCRPPGNRVPSSAEAASCEGYLLRQLEVIRPEFICCLGKCAAENLLKTTESIGRLRGRFHDSHGAKVVVTYHPAYLLRNPAAKKPAWEDLKMLMREMGIAIPDQYA